MPSSPTVPPRKQRVTAASENVSCVRAPFRRRNVVVTFRLVRYNTCCRMDRPQFEGKNDSRNITSVKEDRALRGRTKNCLQKNIQLMARQRLHFINILYTNILLFVVIFFRTLCIHLIIITYIDGNRPSRRLGGRNR